MSVSSGDIFGNPANAPNTSVSPLVVDTTASAAQQLIDELKWLALNYVDKTAQSVDWLSFAANQGQSALVNRQLQLPDRLTSSNVLQNWTTPAMPSLPSFPALPSDLKFDVTLLKSAVAADVTALQTSWMAHFLPTTTDTSRYDTLFVDILNGSDDAIARAKFDALEADLKAALLASTTKFNNDLATNITASKAALTTNVAGLQPKIDAALAVARDDTTNIAFARARDQAAREAARQELEAVEEFAARGFSMPGGMIAAQAAMARQATLDAASRSAADEAVKAQGMYLDIAKIAVSGWMEATGFQLNSEITAFRSFMETSLRAAEMEMGANRAKAEQAFKHLGLRLDFTKFAGEFALKYRLGVTNAMNDLINAYANLNRNESIYLQGIAQAQRENLHALIEYYKVSLAQADMGIKVSLSNNENDIKFSQIAAQFIGTAVGEHVKAAMASSDLFARIASMSLSGLNGVASVSTAS